LGIISLERIIKADGGNVGGLKQGQH